MAWRNSSVEYGSVAKLFHWRLFVLIVSLLAVGIFMANQTFTPEIFTLYKWHKTIGVVALVLVVGRLIWRFMSPPPPLPTETPALEKWAAHGTHFLIYAAIVIIPVSGWLMSSAAPFPNLIIGDIQLPALIEQNEEASKFWSTVHYWAGRALIALLALHVSAALFHHFVRKDQILRRMLPGRLKGTP